MGGAVSSRTLLGTVIGQLAPFVVSAPSICRGSTALGMGVPPSLCYAVISWAANKDGGSTTRPYMSGYLMHALSRIRPTPATTRAS